MVAIAMASCSNDEIVKTSPGQAIDFRTAMATRAITETTNGNLTGFFVTAFSENDAEKAYFENLEFTREGENSSIFTSNTKYYYPGDGSQLTFYAYSPSKDNENSKFTINNDTDKITLTGFSPAKDISKQIDLIATSATGSKENTDGVKLSFKHLLTQICITGINTNSAYDIKVKGIRIGQFVSQDDYEINSDPQHSRWKSNDQNKEIYEIISEQEVSLSEESQELMFGHGNAMLIPQSTTSWNPDIDKGNNDKGAYFSLLVRITTQNGAVVYPFKEDTREYAWAALGIERNFIEGTKLTVTLDFSEGAGWVDPTEEIKPGEPILGEEIKFDVEVEDWMEEEDWNPWENDFEDPFA